MQPPPAGRTLGLAMQRATAFAAPWLCCTVGLLLTRRCAAALRRSWIRRELRHAVLVLRRLQELAGACAAVEGHKAARRALAVAGAARELIDGGLLRLLDPSRPREGGSLSLRTLRARAARVELECAACLAGAPQTAASALRRPMGREELVREEQRALASLGGGPSLGCLKRVLTRLRGLESDLDFQAGSGRQW